VSVSVRVGLVTCQQCPGPSMRLINRRRQYIQYILLVTLTQGAIFEVESGEGDIMSMHITITAC